MTLINLDVWHYSQPLPAPVSSSRHRWHTREGLLLRLTLNSGEVGQGEASPLPGYSQETIDEAHFCLSALNTSWFNDVLALAEPGPVLKAIAESSVASIPSARFAVETALLDLLAQRAHKPLWQLFADSPNRGVTLSRVLPNGSTELALAAAEQAWQAGIRTLKVKVGSAGRWAEELALLGALRQRFGSELCLRLDANQSFDGADLTARLAALAVHAPQYVEEPCPLPTLTALAPAERALPVVLAFDETLSIPGYYNQVIAWLADHPGTTLVLKPMSLGGLAACFDWADLAERHQGCIALSHLLDGPVALTACAHLASCLPGKQLAAGLVPHPGLHAWPAVSLSALQGGTLTPPSAAGLMPALLAPPSV